MKRNSAPLKTALIGAGRIAETWTRVLAEHPEIDVRAVVDPRTDAAEALAARLGCEAVGEALPLLEKGALEAVVICTPPATHVALARAAIRAGSSVLCEKPLALGEEEARDLCGSAERAGVTLAMASKYRFVGDVVHARELLVSGRLGEVAWIDNVFTARVAMAGRWNADPAAAGGGVLIDNGTHSVDLVRFLAGPITAVQALEGPRFQQLEVEDTVRLWLRTAGGAGASVDLSWSLDRHAEAFLEVQGSEGCVQVGWRGSRYRLAGDDTWTDFGQGYDKQAAFRGQLDNFCAAARGREPLRANGDDALASVRVVEAAYASLRSSSWVELEPEPER